MSKLVILQAQSSLFASPIQARCACKVGSSQCTCVTWSLLSRRATAKVFGKIIIFEYRYLILNQTNRQSFDSIVRKACIENIDAKYVTFTGSRQYNLHLRESLLWLGTCALSVGSLVVASEHLTMFCHVLCVFNMLTFATFSAWLIHCVLPPCWFMYNQATTLDMITILLATYHLKVLSYQLLCCYFLWFQLSILNHWFLVLSK